MRIKKLKELIRGISWHITAIVVETPSVFDLLNDAPIARPSKKN